MIHSFLRNNAEYRLKFADRVQKHFCPGGPLYVDTNSPAVDPAHPERNRPGALYLKRIGEVDPAIVLESARWGDSVPARTNNPFTRADFLTELNWMTNTYFPQRSSNVLNQYQYPASVSGCSWGGGAELQPAGRQCAAGVQPDDECAPRDDLLHDQRRRSAGVWHGRHQLRREALHGHSAHA